MLVEAAVAHHDGDASAWSPLPQALSRGVFAAWSSSPPPARARSQIAMRGRPRVPKCRDAPDDGNAFDSREQGGTLARGWALARRRRSALLLFSRGRLHAAAAIEGAGADARPAPRAATCQGAAVALAGSATSDASVDASGGWDWRRWLDGSGWLDRHGRID